MKEESFNSKRGLKEVQIKNPNTCEHYKKVGCVKDICDCYTLVPKQETLEEAAEKWYDSTEENKDFPKIKAFKDGAKWQQEQYTIEEQRVGHTINELDKEYIKGFNEGSAYQQERMYSEEDMKNAFDSAREFNSLDGVVDVHIVLPMGGDMSDLQPLHFTFDEWFNEFKKK